jgi:predicted amidohydrolase YtcJ
VPGGVPAQARRPPASPSPEQASTRSHAGSKGRTHVVGRLAAPGCTRIVRCPTTSTRIEEDRLEMLSNRHKQRTLDPTHVRGTPCAAARPPKAQRRLPLLACALAMIANACSMPQDDTADVVFRGGTIWTADPAQARVEAVAIADGRIVFVGSAADVAAFTGPDTEVVDLEGRMLLPSFIDTHVHPTSGGIELGECDLNGSTSRQEVVERVGACNANQPDAPWVRGGGFDLPLFPAGAPSRELLDSLVPDRPAFLSSADGHSAWVNSRALELAGVTAATPDPPPDGVIVRAASGEPQGTLRERAMELVSCHLPEYTAAEIQAGLKRGLDMATSLGITTVHEASASEAYVAAYRALDDQGLLNHRAIIAMGVEEDGGTAQVADLVSRRDRYATRLVRPIAAKVFLDGVIEGGTAALLTDYLDRPGWKGELNAQPTELEALVAALDDAGFKVHVHAIGDRAIRVAFDAFEAQHARDGGTGPRHIMAHIQLFDPADLDRFAELGVVASFQPLWFFADSYITDLTEPRLGPERSRWLYPIRTVLETGALVAAGSDWSVSSMDPLQGIEVAITRRGPMEEEGSAWIPEERVDLETMLTAYTLNAAAAGDMEGETGSITVGKSADLVLLDTDLFAVPPERISDARVEMTMFEGRVVYRRGAAPR